MEYVCTVFNLISSCDLDSLFVLLRISTTRCNNCCSYFWLKLNLQFVQGAIAAVLHHLVEVRIKKRQQNLGFWIAEATVKLESLWAELRIKHHTGIQYTHKFATFGSQTIHGCLKNILAYKLTKLIGKNGGWGVCSHTTSVKSSVSFTNALVVLCCWHENDSCPIRKSKDGCLWSSQTLLDYHLRSCISKFFLDHDLFEAL
mmetsp:Transcript_26842/g.43146  ORF Transcript_26842/g.43146 Transcript_26842/m.43146 type:complete len:201 (+) Transcript_26842:925-1527(+)